MYGYYKTEESALSKQTALRALACVENVHVLFKYLTMTINYHKIPISRIEIRGRGRQP